MRPRNVRRSQAANRFKSFFPAACTAEKILYAKRVCFCRRSLQKRAGRSAILLPEMRQHFWQFYSSMFAFGRFHRNQDARQRSTNTPPAASKYETSRDSPTRSSRR